MGRFNQNDHAARIELLLDHIGNRLGHAFLNLRPPCNLVDNPGQLAQPNDLAIGQVPHMRLARKRQEMMLAHAVEFNVPNQHDFIVIFSEYPLEVNPRVLVQPREYLCIHPGHSRRSLKQSLAVRILPDGDEYLADSLLNPCMVDRR